jgi:hypothetical protein
VGGSCGGRPTHIRCVPVLDARSER